MAIARPISRREKVSFELGDEWHRTTQEGLEMLVARLLERIVSTFS